MHAVSTNQVADIFHFNDKGKYIKESILKLCLQKLYLNELLYFKHSNDGPSKDEAFDNNSFPEQDNFKNVVFKICTKWCG